MAITLQKYKNKNIAIYGMGATGFSVAKKYKKLKAKIFCWDDNKKIRNKIKKLNLPIERFWLKNTLIDNIVISPGIDINKCKLKNYLKKNSNKIITDIDLFFELNNDAQIISITGTNGKSTTCKIVEKILRTAKYNVKTLGNIGKPILSFEKSKKRCIFILEISSYQLQYSKLFRSKHAIILNISPDHLERHKNIKNYTKVKSKIFFAQRSSDYSYINSNNKYSKSIKKLFVQKKLKSRLIYVNKSNSRILQKNINNKFFYNNANMENLAFAYKVARNLKISNKTIIKALNQFKGLPHRQEVIFSNKFITCINDSKATSFDATLQCLMNFKKIYWIVGGLPKLNDKFNLNHIYRRISKAYIIGKNSKFFVKQIRNQVPYKISYNLKNAIKHIYNDLKNTENKHSTVLLSPAAASFDQFKNFEDRGLHFKKLVLKRLKKSYAKF